MQRPDIKSDGVMIDGFMLESEMSPVGSVRGVAEPVLLAAKSEVFTPVVFAGGGGVVAAAAPLAVVEAVTARVSVLPVVGSELSTGLSATVGVTGQLVVDLGDTLVKVGHGAGQSCIRVVPAERLPFLSEVCGIMLSWIRPVAVLTSQFFLSDENEEVDMPSQRNGSQASLRQEGDFDSLHMGPQKTGHALTAGPAVNRWDWECILGNVVRFSKLRDIPKSADKKDFRNLNRKCGLTVGVIAAQSSIQSLESGPVTSGYPRFESHGETSNPEDRHIGRYDDSDWSRENPNWAFGKGVSRTGTTCGEYCAYIKETSLNDWAVSNRPSVEPRVFRSPLQALRPSAEVCKVMTVPNSHCVRVVTPDEHVITDFHEILIHDMEMKKWPPVTLSDIGCLRLDWPKDLFTFVGRYIANWNK